MDVGSVDHKTRLFTFFSLRPFLPSSSKNVAREQQNCILSFSAKAQKGLCFRM